MLVNALKVDKEDSVIKYGLEAWAFNEQALALKEEENVESCSSVVGLERGLFPSLNLTHTS